jgi:N-methylhydantoinase A
MGCDVLQAAAGIVALANEHMARALRVISVERGHDPADHALLSFGGAGGLHACDLAELLNMHRIIIPARAGVLSAMGMLVSEPGRELSRAVLEPLADLTDADIKREFHALETEARAQLFDEGHRAEAITFKHQLELRYQGQSATIPVTFEEGGSHAEAFHSAHAKASGLRLSHPVELVNIRLGARAPAALQSLDVPADGGRRSKPAIRLSAELGRRIPVYRRNDLESGKESDGPCIVTEPVATSWIKPGWKMRLDRWGNLLLRRSSVTDNPDP